MSIHVIKDQIFQFLSSETPEVMAIKGEWGVGKTYSWKKFLLEAKVSDGVKLDRYSYVSLFGINSLEVFKYTIFENVVKKAMIGTEVSLDTFKTNAADLIKSLGRKSINLFKDAPFIKSINPAIETISFLSLNSTLICIDDLERKGSDLDIRNILGLISQLKEQKKCKVVLLLNDSEDGLENYNKYSEKVIDIELKFAPTSEECAAIAYSDNKEYFPKLTELVTNLGIHNIRILKKIERLVELALPLAHEYEPEIKDQILQSLALYSWCYYCSKANGDIPSLDFVTSKRYSMYGISKDDENEVEKKWKTTLQSYNYLLTDELDLILAEAVKTGFIIEDEFKTKASNKNQEILAAKSEGSFSDAWRLYHDNFDDNAGEVVTGIYESFKKNYKHITPLNLNGTVSLFRELGEDDKATEIIDLYIEKRRDETELFNLEKNNIFGDVEDSEIINKFDNLYNESIIIESSKEVLNRIAGKNGWNQSDEIVLANTTAEEYYELFKSEKSKRLSSLISTCLKFGKLGNANKQQKEIASRATEALKLIGSESEINKRRVKKFGIDA